MVGPVIYTFGNDKQKNVFCLTFLNSIHGGAKDTLNLVQVDLASLKTKAVKTGDKYIVNGSKTWTTLAQNADWIFAYSYRNN